MTTYEKVCKSCAEMERKIEADKARLESTRRNLNAAQECALRIFDDLKVAMLAGKGPASVKDIEAQIAENNAQITRDTALIEGLGESIPGMETELAALIARKNEAFAFLAEKWLKKEIAEYDAARTAFASRIQRLLYVQGRLFEAGRHDMYQACVGDSAEYIPHQIPVRIDGFDRSIFMRPPYWYPGTEMARQIENEITAREV